MITHNTRLSPKNQKDHWTPTLTTCQEKNEKASQKSSKRQKSKKKGQVVRKAQRESLGEAPKFSLWKLSENVAYMQYLIENEQLFYTSRSQRKCMKINVLMSQAIRSRTADQCRSHHQKMIKYHRDIPNIILHIRRLMKKEQQSKESPKVDQENIQFQPQPEVFDQLPVDGEQDEVIYPEYDWESWIYRNEMDEQERLVDLWLNGVEDKYGNLS